MRQLLFIILTSFILVNCSNEKAPSDDTEANKTDSLKLHFASVFNGIWVLTDYIDAIEKTKSPFKSAEKLQGLVTLVIDGTNPCDSIQIDASLNNHEGYSFTAYFLTGQNENSLKTNLPDNEEKTNFYEMEYETVNDKTSLFLYHYNKEYKVIGKRQFSKVTEKVEDSDPAWGIQQVVNSTLFSGNYLLIDNKNVVTKINLKNDGSLTGHSNFSTYYVSTDFMGDPEAGLDEIVFNPQTKNAHLFVFTNANDTTYLYSTATGGEILKSDKIQYKLVRQ
jgi:hypothetical protein